MVGWAGVEWLEWGRHSSLGKEFCHYVIDVNFIQNFQLFKQLFFGSFEGLLGGLGNLKNFPNFSIINNNLHKQTIYCLPKFP